MRYKRLTTLTVVLCFWGHSSLASQTATHPDPVAGEFTIRDFRFATGETLPSLRLHYLTIGSTPTRRVRHGSERGVDPSSAPAERAATSSRTTSPARSSDPDSSSTPPGTSSSCPTALDTGNRASRGDGLRMKFPRYTYADLVDAQYRLLTDGLKVNRVFLVMGVSMGGMLSWVWGERYPDFMDGLVPMACMPTQIAGRNRMLRKTIVDSVRNDPEWNNGEYVRQPLRGLLSAFSAVTLMTSGAVQLQKAGPTRDEADRYFDEQLRAQTADIDANDLIYQFEASRDYDPSLTLERIVAPVLAINAADDNVNPPELGLMEPLLARVKRGRYVLIPKTPDSRGHGTLSIVSTWEVDFKAFLDELKGAR